MSVTNQKSDKTMKQVKSNSKILLFLLFIPLLSDGV